MQVSVELKCCIHSFDPVASEYQPLDGRIKGYGDDVQLASFALYDESVIIAHAAGGTPEDTSSSCRAWQESRYNQEEEHCFQYDDLEQKRELLEYKMHL